MQISHWKGKLLLTAGYLLLVTILYFLGVPCIFQTLLGIPCPGCGMTRAILSALRLDLKAAFLYHPMFWSMPILYLYFLLDKGIFPKKLWNRLLLWGICGGFVLNWFVKILLSCQKM